eukprot:6759440-Prymnesium_polylepis.1
MSRRRSATPSARVVERRALGTKPSSSAAGASAPEMPSSRRPAAGAARGWLRWSWTAHEGKRVRALVTASGWSFRGRDSSPSGSTAAFTHTAANVCGREPATAVQCCGGSTTTQQPDFRREGAQAVSPGAALTSLKHAT